MLYVYLRNVHSKYSKLDKALKAYDKSIELDPNCVDGYIRRGCCYACWFKLKEAEENINKALGLDPKNKTALKWKEQIERLKKMGLGE